MASAAASATASASSAASSGAGAGGVISDGVGLASTGVPVAITATSAAGVGGGADGLGLGRAGAAASVALPASAPLTKFKICFLGDQGVGKTSIIRNFQKGQFDGSYKATIGVDFVSKSMYLDDRTVRLQIWDTAGQERFWSLAPSYIRDSQVAVVVYDITSRASFLNVSQWADYVRAERGSDAILALVGNKTDLAEARQISVEDGEAKAKALNAVVFLETSAKAGYNVKPLFQRLATTLPSDKPAEPTAAESNLIDLRLTPKPPRGSESADSGCPC